MARERRALCRLLAYRGLHGAPGGNRTHDPRIKNPLLYQLSYRHPFHNTCRCGCGL